MFMWHLVGCFGLRGESAKITGFTCHLLLLKFTQSRVDALANVVIYHQFYCYSELKACLFICQCLSCIMFVQQCHMCIFGQ